MADGLCLLPLKSLLSLDRMECQAPISFSHYCSYWLSVIITIIYSSCQGTVEGGYYHLKIIKTRPFSNVRNLSRVATVHLPQRVPYGVHGLWLDKQFLDSKQRVSDT